jgi:hypothetical protein
MPPEWLPLSTVVLELLLFIIMTYPNRNTGRTMLEDINVVINSENPSWRSVKNKSRKLGKKIKNGNFFPDVIFAVDEKAAAIAKIIRSELNEEILICTGASVLRSEVVDSKFKYVKEEKAYIHNNFKNLKFFRTSSQYVQSPTFNSEFNNLKILVVQDYALTEEAAKKIRSLLINKGNFRKENIKVCCLFVNEELINNKIFDYSGKYVNKKNLRLPWDI